MKMKTILLILMLGAISEIHAGDEKFKQVMISNIDLVYKASTIEEYQSAVNAFDRIAGAEKNRWEPLYYSAFGNVMMALKATEAGRKDEYLDLALAAVTKAIALAPLESELPAMEGFIHMIRVTVDPGTRGPEFSMKANMAYGKALQLNPENPRALALQAQMEFGTANFFRSSTASACQMNESALTKFAGSKAENPLAPAWGESMALGLRVQCEQTAKK